MAGVPYDAEHIARFFDDCGTREWDRFDASPMDRVGLEVHLRLLREHIREGDRVLDAGAGPGRFTLELARLRATVVAGDISPRQLELHAEKTASVESSIESRELLDILDLSRFDDESFDKVVCFGGPLSYVLGEVDRALAELLRVTNNGHVCRLYRWSDLEQLLGRHPCRVVTASAANFLSVRNDAWDERFLEVEIEACREPGALDGGTHILAVVERL